MKTLFRRSGHSAQRRTRCLLFIGTTAVYGSAATNAAAGVLFFLLCVVFVSGRYYCDPQCRGLTGEVDQTKPLHATGGENMKMRYVLPDIECDHCILQMVYRELVWLGAFRAGNGRIYREERARCSCPTYTIAFSWDARSVTSTLERASISKVDVSANSTVRAAVEARFSHPGQVHLHTTGRRSFAKGGSFFRDRAVDLGYHVLLCIRNQYQL